MKKINLTVVLSLLCMVFVGLLYVAQFEPHVFSIATVTGDWVVSMVLLLFIVISHLVQLSSLKKEISKKKKELLFEKVSHTDETMEGIHSLLEEFKLETKDPHVISSFKSTASKALITKYSLCKTLFNFCKDVSNDESTSRTTSDLRDIFASTISANLVQENFKRLFVGDIQEILELQDVERAKVLFQWATEDLHVFNPPKHFAEEIGKLRTLSLKQV